jgi:hypothetical protein
MAREQQHALKPLAVFVPLTQGQGSASLPSSGKFGRLGPTELFLNIVREGRRLAFENAPFGIAAPYFGPNGADEGAYIRDSIGRKLAGLRLYAVYKCGGLGQTLLNALLNERMSPDEFLKAVAFDLRKEVQRGHPVPIHSATPAVVTRSAMTCLMRAMRSGSNGGAGVGAVILCGGSDAAGCCAVASAPPASEAVNR